MASLNELSRFLQEVERRAFKYAMMAVQNEDTALDMVQDAMLKLAEKYGDKPVEELPLLFYRILQNGITDHHRRQKLRNFWITPLATLFGKGEDGEEIDPLDSLEVEAPRGTGDPARLIADQQVMALVESGLHRLPERQREAFLLRYWEGYDVADTAAIMGCSEGSVKTHCSRAVSAMSAWMRQHGVEESGDE